MNNQQFIQTEEFQKELRKAIESGHEMDLCFNPSFNTDIALENILILLRNHF